MPTPTPQIDPINSPHPLPWHWIESTHQAAVAAQEKQIRYYRSQGLRSPNQLWLAYSRICFEVDPQLYASRLTSLLFVKHLETGEIRGIQPPSPSDHAEPQGDHIVQPPGHINLVMPISWNHSSDQLLARDFESVFCSSHASDYAVVWDSNSDESHTLAPYNIAYEYAILQGWSQTHPNEVLFKTARLGHVQQHLWRVSRSGKAIPSAFDQAELFGQVMATALDGPQAPHSDSPEILAS